MYEGMGGEKDIKGDWLIRVRGRRSHIGAEVKDL